MNNIQRNASVGFIDLLAVTFIVLKLAGVIHWGWVWVLAPIWGQFVLIFLLGLWVNYVRSR